MTCADVERLSAAYIDGELALEAALAVESHVADCPGCAATMAQTRALRSQLRSAPYFRAPDGLADRVRAMAADRRPAARPARETWHARAWMPWLVAFASAAVVLMGAAGVMRQRALAAATAEAVIDGHVRALVPGHLLDVVSTDQHTVKPWFAGRLDFSPAVVDLAGQGFPLVGGRVDYVARHAAAALVYKRREHVINAFLWPETGGSTSHVVRGDPRGYHVISWTRGGVAVWIVSDVSRSELEVFANALDAAMGAG